MAGRFPLYTDADIQGPVIKALQKAGWDVVRAIDVLPEGTEDLPHFEKAVKLGRVLVTNDDDQKQIAIRWYTEGRTFVGRSTLRPGILIRMPDCSFCRIAAGEAAAAVVLDEREALAFLDHRPLFHGHCLLIPRRHVETLADLPEELVLPFFRTAQRLARAVERAMEAEGTFLAINNKVSQSVAHLHVHVVPRRKKDGLRGFFWPRQKYASTEAMRVCASRIREAYSALPG